MFKKILSLLVCVLGMLSANSQVTFSLSPNNVSPAIGETVNFDVVVTNFTDVNSFQFTMEWDATLFEFVAVDNFNLTNFSAASFFNDSPSTVRFSWNATGFANTTVPNGTAIYRLRLKTLLASDNYWVRFQTSDLEIGQNGVPVSPNFGNVGNPPGTSSQPVTLRTISQSVQTNQNVCVGVTADNFTDIQAAHWAMKWDSTVLRYESLTKLNTTLAINNTHFTTTQAVTNGRLNFNWTSSPAKTVANADTLFKVCFTAIGATGTSTPVQILTSGSEIIRSSGGVGVAVSLTPTNGTVNIANTPPPTGTLTFSGSHETATVGDTVCVQIFAKNFKDIAIMTYSMHWDSTKLSIVTAISNKDVIAVDTLKVPSPAPNPTYSSPNYFNYKPTESGTLRMLADFTNYPGGALTLNADSTFLYKVCLKVIGGANTSTNFTFNGIPLKIQILDVNLANVIPSFSNGIITIGNSTLPAVDATNTITNVSCNGGNNGSITLTPTGGNGTYTYNWTGPNSFTATSKDISNLKTGTYNVTISSSTATVKNLTLSVTEPAILGVSNTVTNVKCNTGTDGAVNLTVTGGTSPYTFSWAGPDNYTSTAEDITGLKAGNYTVTVTDSKSCAQTVGPISVTEPTAITITPSVTNASCNTNNGAINITVTGGTAPYTFKWTGPNGYTATSEDISSIATGSYIVEVTDGAGCIKTSSSIAVSTTNPSFSATPSITNITCNGNTNGAISLTVTGGNGNFTYTWSGPNSFSATTKDITTLKAGTYNVTITESGTGCQVVPNAMVVTEPTDITIATPTVVDVKCKGGQTGTISLSVSGGNGGYTYQWTGPNGFTAVNTSAIGPLVAGNYNVTVTDSKSCTKTLTIEVKEPAGTALTLGAPAITNAKCNGGNTGAIIISVSGGTPQYSYAWTGPNGFTSTDQNLSQRFAGIYKVTVKDANECTVTSSDINIGEPTAISITETVKNSNGACNGEIALSVTGGTSPYTYAWSSSGAGQGLNPTAQNQVNLCPNETYRVTVTDANGCTATKAITVTGTIAPPIQITSVTVESHAGCPGNALGVLKLAFTGGKSPFSFEWLNTNGAVISRVENPTNLGAGKYRVKITDAVGQTAISTESEIKQSASTISISTSSINAESCSGNDGAIYLAISGGDQPFIYKWNTGAESKDLLNVKEGKYSVTVTDINKCFSDKQELIIPKNPCPLVVNSSKKDPSCSSSKGSITINITNGEPGYVIKWSATDSVRVNNAPSKAASYEITNLVSGTYNITVTDAKGQTNTSTVTLEATSDIIVIKNVTHDTGNCKGSIVLSVSGGSPLYTYIWNDGATSRDRFNLCAGQILSVTVTDTKGCFKATSNDTIISNVRNFAISNVVNITNATCPDDSLSGKIDITVEGGVKPYKFSWSNGSTDEDLIRIKPGTYSVTVTDNTQPTNLRIVQTYVLGSNSTLKITDLTTTAGAATVTIEGGQAPYTVTWCNGNSVTTSNTVVPQSNLLNGNCGVTITDSKGCKVSRQFTVAATCAVVTANTNFTGGYNLQCASDKTGSATVTNITDQTILPPYQYRWDNGETSNTAFKLASGARSVTIIGNNGKTCVANFVMRAPDEMKVTATPVTTNGECGMIANVTGGVAPYKYRWSTPKGDTTQSIKDLINSTSYFVLVVDNFGCTTDPGVATAICPTFCLKGPEVLTPNEDSKNDKFDIEKCDFTNIRLQVFNRWGQEVYTNADYLDQWEGNTQDGKTGKQLPEGVYMYILRGVEPNGKETVTRGTVSILRY